MRIPGRVTGWRVLASALALCTFAAVTAAVPARAEPAPGLCQMNTSRGAVPADFPIQACVDGSNIWLYNTTTLVLRVFRGGDVGKPVSTPTDFSLAVDVTRLKDGGEWVLLPGDKLKIPIGSGSAAVNVKVLPSAEDFYFWANLVATFFPLGKVVSGLAAFAQFISDINADFNDYENCKADRNFLGQVGCFARFSAKIQNAVDNLGLGLTAAAGQAVLGVLLSAETFAQWAAVQVPQFTTFIYPPQIKQAALRSPRPSGGGGGNPPGSGTWTAAEAPLPGNAAQTNGFSHVACPSSSCAAVGSYADSAGNSHIVVDWGSGSSWTPVDAPLPGDAIISASGGPGIAAEACAAGSSCVLAGDYANSAGSQGLLIAGSGTSWTATKAPVPGNAAPNPGVSIYSVACPSAAFCVAVGTYTDSTGEQQGLLLTGTGSSWKATQAPLPSNAAATPGPYLSSVACESAASCVAVGNYLDSSSRGQGLLITWSGTSWAPIESPAPGGAPGGAGLQSVGCSASACAAAGLYSDGSNAFGLLVSGSGSTWSAAEAPLPAGAAADPSPYFKSMTCPAASTCVAVGFYSSGSIGNLQGLLLTGMGSSWTAAQAPLPAGAASGAYLYSVACGSTSACVVTGDYADSSSTAHGLLLTGSGSSWTIVSPPVPANANPANQTEFFYDSACPSATTCVTVGSYTDSSAADQGLLLSGPS